MHRTILTGGLAALLFTAAATALPQADLVLVDKRAQRLYLYQGQRLLAAFPVAFGGQPQGHKQQEGDGRTPEGRYLLDDKKADSGYYKAIHISYPNAADRAAAAARGVSPGGQVMIHGQRNGFGWAAALTQRVNWTNGCIALRNADMQQVWQAVAPGTPIVIRP
ncbi:murein L,D-transpeptidase family protein [Vogesella sp. GCM10023246]|uniref:L,D-transpeptidase family protein n=1 Tax=Vogesella oryzagri TaxID=3160864 RepID=A0ABV1M161_9NEIS